MAAEGSRDGDLGNAAASGVNGAATGWPRKVSACALTIWEWSSVNGAATGWPRKVRRQAGARRSRQASMGPRPDGRGRQWQRACAKSVSYSVNGAATGWPRKAASAAAVTQRPTRVNGAATGWPRKGHALLLAPDGLVRRQWGRDRMAAEGTSRNCTRVDKGSVNGAATGWPRKARLVRRDRRPHCRRQWGRDRMAAEGLFQSLIKSYAR